MSEVQNQDGAGFSAPPAIKKNEGAADTPKAGGVLTAKKASGAAAKSTKSTKRDIKVVAIDKGWFDCKRVLPGMKFTVSEQEFSASWMQKI